MQGIRTCFTDAMVRVASCRGGLAAVCCSRAASEITRPCMIWSTAVALMVFVQICLLACIWKWLVQLSGRACTISCKTEDHTSSRFDVGVSSEPHLAIRAYASLAHYAIALVAYASLVHYAVVRIRQYWASLLVQH